MFYYYYYYYSSFSISTYSEPLSSPLSEQVLKCDGVSLHATDWLVSSVTQADMRASGSLNRHF